MLRDSWRSALAAVRAASWRAPLVAVVSYAPLFALAPVAGGQLLVVGLVLHVVLLLALVRVLGAWRPEPLPPLPQVDDQGRRVLGPPRPGPPTTDADRGPFRALRNSWRLARPSISLTGLYLLGQVGALATATALSGGRLSDYSPLTQTAAVLPVAALFLAFVALAPQRVALEGDPRVLVAAAHSVRIAKSTYGVLLALTLVEPAVAVGVLLGGAGEDVPTGRAIAVALAGLVAATVGKVLVTALSNELYLRGARLDLPAET